MSDERDISKDVNRSLGWVGMASAMVAVLDLVAQVVVLALWISPSEYGIAAMAITLFPVLDMATDMGLSAAVIQRDDHTADKISTVFWLNFIVSLLLSGLLALVVGPALGRLQGHEVVGWMLAFYGVRLIWANTYLIPRALLKRELRFKELSIIRIIANFCEFTGKIGFAATGFGVWCFVLGPFMREIVTGIGTQIVHPWRPRLVLKVREAIDWMVFGLKTSASQILFHLYTNVDYQVVGYFFGDAANGFYRLAYEIVLEPARMIAEVVVQIAFPTFARLKHDTAKLIEQLIQFTRMNLVIMLGFLGMVMVASEDLIRAFWGEQWVPSADVARVLCAVGVLRALSFVVPPLLDGMGRPSLTLAYTTVAAVVLPLSFLGGAVWIGEPTLGAAGANMGGDLVRCLSLIPAPYLGDPEFLAATTSTPGRYDHLSVAIAWAIGYPIAFLVLFAMALDLLKLKARYYIRRCAGIVVCGGIAMAGAYGVHSVTGFIPAAGLRFAIAAGSMAGLFLLLLAYLAGISPRSVLRAIRGESDEPV